MPKQKRNKNQPKPALKQNPFEKWASVPLFLEFPGKICYLNVVYSTAVPLSVVYGKPEVGSSLTN